MQRKTDFLLIVVCIASFSGISSGQSCDPSCNAGETCCEGVCIPDAHGFAFEVLDEATSGITQTQMSADTGDDIDGPGVAAADFDGDGWIDLYIPQDGGTQDLVYRNLGDGTYEKILGDELGINVDSSGNALAGTTAVWVDYDGDQDLDLFIVDTAPATQTCSCTPCVDPGCTCPTEESRFRLYRNEYDGACRTNGNDCFVDVTSTACVWSPGTAKVGGIAAGDLNNDGCVDIYVALRGIGLITAIYVNQCDGTLVDKAAGSGIVPRGVLQWHPFMADFNNDGWLDIYQCVDAGGNDLWINQKQKTQPTFVQGATGDLQTGGFTDMGITLGDYDNDGDLDVYTSNISKKLLLRNDGNVAVPFGVGGSVGSVPSFTNVTSILDVTSGFSWGTTFMDVDRDGFVDMGVTNGFPGLGGETDATVFYRNEENGGAREFNEVGAEVGFTDNDQGVALIAYDFDRDGDLDSFQTANSTENWGQGLLRLRELHQCDGREYLVVKPRTFGSNHFALGAIVRVETAGGLSMMRIISAGNSFYGQEPAEAFFGLDTDTVVDITVEWPDDDTAQGTNGTIVTTTIDDFDVTTLTGYQELTVCPPPGPSDDCDSNGIHDGCDLANGNATDCNNNGVLDSCESYCCTSDECPGSQVCCANACLSVECCSDDDCRFPPRCRPWDNVCVFCYDNSHCKAWQCCAPDGKCKTGFACAQQ